MSWLGNAFGDVEHFFGIHNQPQPVRTPPPQQNNSQPVRTSGPALTVNNQVPSFRPITIAPPAPAGPILMPNGQPANYTPPPAPNLKPQYTGPSFFQRYSPGNIFGGIKQGVTDTIKNDIVGPAADTVKLAPDVVAQAIAEASHNPAQIQAAKDQLSQHALNSWIGPLATLATMGGTNLAAREILSNPNTTPEQKQAQLTAAVNPSYNQTGFDIKDNGLKLFLKSAGLFTQAVATPVLLAGAPGASKAATAAAKTFAENAVKLDKAQGEGGFISFPGSDKLNADQYRAALKQRLDQAAAQEFPAKSGTDRTMNNRIVREYQRNPDKFIDKYNLIPPELQAGGKVAKTKTPAPKTEAPAPAPAPVTAITHPATELKQAVEQHIANASKDQSGFILNLSNAAKNLGEQHHIGPVKTVERAAQKVAGEYGGDITKLRDAIRGTIHISNPANLEAHIKELAQHFDITRVKSNLSDARGNYRQAIVNVRLPSGGEGEIQLTTPEMQFAKKQMQGHALYKKLRGLTDVTSSEYQRINALLTKVYSYAHDAEDKRLNSSSVTSLPSSKALTTGKGEPSAVTARTESPPAASTLTKTSSTSKNLGKSEGVVASDITSNTIPKTTEKASISNKPPAEPPKPAVPTPDLVGAPKGGKPSRMANVTVQNSPKVNELTKALTLAHDVRYNEATVRAGQDAAKATYGSMNLDKAALEITKKLNDTKLGNITRQDVFNAHEVADRLQKTGKPEDLKNASDIYAKLSEHHSAAGQMTQAAAALVKQSPQGMLYSATKALEKAKVELTPERLSEIQRRIELVKSAKTEDEKIMRYDELVQHVNQQIPRSKVSAGIGIWRAGLLSGPETAAKVTVSHLVTAPLELASRPVMAGIDKAVGLATGKRTITLSPKQDVPEFIKGEVKGLKAMKTKFKTNIDVPGTGGFDTKMGGGEHQTAYERFFASKIHGNLFKPNYSGAYRLEMRNQARLAAKDAGLTGAKRSEFIDNFMSDPTTAAKDAAKQYAEKFTNMNKTELGKFANTIQSFNPGGLPVGRWLVPFARIPTAIAMKGIVDLTPIGIMKGVTKAVIQQIQHGSFDQRALSETIGKASVGSVATTAVGFKLMEGGRMTLQEPNDPKEKALWLAQGKNRNSIYVGGKVTKDKDGNFHYQGGKWITLNAFGPGGIAIGLGGAFHNALRAHGDPVNATLTAMASAAKLVSDQPYFKGISGASNAINNPKQYAQSYINSAENSLIPAGSQQIARGSDTKQRTTPQGVKQTLGQGIPGVREKLLPAQKDLYGNDVPSGNGGSFKKDVIGTVNPFYPSASRNEKDNVTAELQRLYGSLGSSDSPAISQPQKSQTINGKKVVLDNHQMSDYIGVSGKLIHSGVANLLQNPDYKGLSDADKTKQIDTIITAAHDAAKISLFGNNPKSLSSATKTALFDTNNLGKQINIPGLSLGPGLGPQPKAELTKVAKMTATDKTSYLANPKNKYNYDVATFQNDVALGKYKSDPVKAFSAQQTLHRESITSNFPAEVTSLYGMSKAGITDYLNGQSPAKAKQLENSLYAIDNALYNAGVISKAKFANGIASSGSGGSSKNTISNPVQAFTTAEFPKLASLISQSEKPFAAKTISYKKASFAKPKAGKVFKVSKPKAIARVKAPKFLSPAHGTVSKSKGTVKLTV